MAYHHQQPPGYHHQPPPGNGQQQQQYPPQHQQGYNNGGYQQPGQANSAPYPTPPPSQHGQQQNRGPGSPQPMAAPNVPIRNENQVPGFTDQLKAAMTKNWHIKTHNKLSTCCEISLPVVFVLGLIAIWSATKDTEVPEKIYIPTTPVINVTSPSLLRSAACVNTSFPNYTASLPFFPCLASAPSPTTAAPSPSSGASVIFAYCLAPNPELPVRGLCFYQIPPTAVASIIYDSFAKPQYVPTLDEMILLKWTASPFNSLSFAPTLLERLRQGSHLYFYPDTQQVRDLVNYLNTTSVFFKYVYGGIFNNEVEASAFRNALGNGRKNWAHIQVPEPMTATKMKVMIRMNRTVLPSTQTTDSVSISFGLGQQPNAGYLASGYLTLQNAIQDFYATQIVGRPALPTNTARTVMTPMPTPYYVSRQFVQIASVLAPLALVFAFLYGVSQLAKSLVEEKETRTREAMLIMGLSTPVFYASWIVTYMLQYLITSILCTILLKLVILPAANSLIVFGLLYFFMLSTIALSTLISSFISRARVASVIAPIFFFIIGVPSFSLLGQAREVVLPLCLLSPTALGVGLQLVFTKESGEGVQPSNMNNRFDKVDMSAVYGFLILDIFWYFALGFYLDAVLPKEWGTRKHPLFFILDPIRWCMSRGKSSTGPQEFDNAGTDGRDPNGVYEDENARAGVRPSVRLRCLRKEFGALVAVNDLSLDMYESDVTVLLGHNGAGKTTAINLMTGMFDPDNGDCYIYDTSVVHDLARVRQSIGFCPQHNILFPSLTCRQHLEFFARIKGVSGPELEQAVTAMLQAVDLLEKQDSLAETMSGGQKRKLSVAIAFVGGNRMVFLDEPTAGMDVGARRFTWELLKSMSVGRSILLTTHYMDEADLLGNRVAIMSKGSLRCMGSPMFLKARLGVGYSLQIAHAASEPQLQRIETMVRQAVEGAESVSHAHGECGFRLPFAATPHFAPLLASLERDSLDLGIRSIGMSMTTLEEVFLKLANDEHVPQTPAPGTAAATAQATRGSAFQDGHTPVEGVRPDEAVVPRAEDINITFIGQLIALFTKRICYIRRDYRTLIFQILIPIVGILVGIGLGSLRDADPPASYLGEGYYGLPTDVYLNNDSAEFNASWLPSSYPINYIQNTTVYALNDALLKDYNKHQARYRYFAVSANQTQIYPAGNAHFLMVNESFTHSSVLGMAAYRRALYKSFGMSDSVSWEVGSFPYEYTQAENVQASSISAFLLAIFIMIPFTFVPSTFVSFVVREREIKAKHLQIISGMNMFTYWVSNFLFDVCCFLLTLVLTFIVFLIFDRKEYIGSGDNFGATFLLFFFFGAATITGAYVCSFAFDSHSTAQTMTMMGNFIAGFLLVLAIFILRLIPTTKEGADVAVYFCRLIPAFCLGEGLNNMAIRQLGAAFGGTPKSVWEMDTVGWNILYCALTAPLFAIITLILDHPARRMRTEQLLHNPDQIPPAIPNEDPDVAQERNRIESCQTDNDVVVVRHLRKEYGTKVAVKNLSFGVHQGEVFGFLGTNGAGKTTTISILCGEQLPSTGHGWVDKFDVVSQPTEARANIGYCPQFDATIDLLTPEEHLRLFSGLRGLSPDATTRCVEYLLSFCDLTPHRAKLSGELSGGNRRKLSVAIALLGAPKVVFLDEPSAGMDPMARRALWTTITEVAKRSSIVLTTHHLEEVEAMAHRVAIMDHGELRCIGSMQHLKSRFGVGFELSVRFRDALAADPFFHELSRAIPYAGIIEARQNKVVYGVPQSSALSTVFDFIERNKSRYNVTDYGVTQTSLEQVFLRISADGEEEGGPPHSD